MAIMSDKMKAQQKQQQEAAKKAAAKKQTAAAKEAPLTAGRRSSRLKNGEDKEVPDQKQSKKTAAKKGAKKNTTNGKNISSYFKKADVDVIDEDPTSSELMIMPPDSLSLTGAGAHFGRAEHRVGLPYFEGTIKIHELRIYPLQYHPQSEKVKEILVARGRKWASLSGIHHMQYKGTGFRVLERGIQRCNVGFNLLLVHSVVISCRSAVEITNHD